MVKVNNLEIENVKRVKAVTPPVPAALVRANLAEMCKEYKTGGNYVG